ncbi:MAG: ribose 5-phosphate isomerase B [Saprospiraceae bacterium]
MKIAFASDHAGFEYKRLLVKELQEAGYTILDLGTHSESPSDYPDHAADIARSIQSGQAERGILVCGSGVGVSVAANKFKGIRAGVCHDTYSAHQAVEHDDVNVLCIGERVVGIALAREIIQSFLNAHFTKEDRHQRRLGKILQIEQDNMR